MWVLLLLIGAPRAQVCACARSAVLPTGAVSRPGEVALSLDYGLSLSGDPDLFRGFHLRDRLGDSMAGMYMPPDLVQTWTAGATVGLPWSLQVSAELPWLSVNKLGESEMPGDVDTHSLGDLSAQLRWGHVPAHAWFVGVSIGPTFPTGVPRTGSIVRTGRGTMGITGQLQAAWLFDPRASLAASLSGADGFGRDENGYRLGANAQGALGVRFTPRENGRMGTSAYTMLRWQGRDAEDALVYENTGYLTHDLCLGLSWRLWERGMRSATVSTRGILPLWQIVGDPMYAQNFAVQLNLAVVAR